MEFTEGVRRRRMIRGFTAEPRPEGTADRLLTTASRAPSAGFSQGFSFLVLEGTEQCAPFYLDRYAQEDKGWADRDEGRWPVPYWYIDTGFAAWLILLAVVDEGLGAVFFGPPAIADFRAESGVPPEWTPIGAIAVGHFDPDSNPVRTELRSRRKPLADLIHRGRW